MATAKAIKSANFNMRISPEKKADLEELFGELGMTLAEAVNIFFSKSLMVGGIPFDVRVPEFNEETLEAIQEARDIASGKIESKTYYSAEEFTAEIMAEIAAEDAAAKASMLTGA